MAKVEYKSITLTSTESELKASVYPPISLDPNGHHELALVSLDMYHSIPNIDYRNCMFRYKYSNENYTIELPTGSYEITAINDYIQKKLVDNGHENVFDIKANINTLKCIITIKDPNVEIDFNGEQSMSDMLGFNKILLSGIGEHEGINIVNIVSVNSILVNCNIIEGSYINSTQRPILYSFFPNVPPGYKLVEKPNSIVYLPVTMPVIDTVRVWLTDQDRRHLNTRGETITMRLVLRSSTK